MTHRQVTFRQFPQAKRRPAPVTVAPGMSVVDISDAHAGVIVGITQAYCLYRLPHTNRLRVSRWRELALANIRPADPWLADDAAGNGHRNASAAVLRELLALEQAGPLTPHQEAVCDELLGYLRGG